MAWLVLFTDCPPHSEAVAILDQAAFDKEELEAEYEGTIQEAREIHVDVTTFPTDRLLVEG